MTRAWFPIALALAGCTSVTPAGVPVTGQWGGPHIGLSLEPGGGRIEYDCAGGTIEPIVPRPDGSFIAAGTHTPERGGPVTVGETLPTYRATFSGTVRGERMTLQGRVETGVDLGPFELRRGAEPGILRCL